MAAPRELFISHASSDRRFVDRLVEVFDRHRIRYWYSPSHLVGAQQWHDEIGRALERCDWFLVVISPAALNSIWVKRELRYALLAKRFNDRIVPAVARACHYRKMSWTLEAIQRIDFTAGFDHGCHDLFRIWRREYRLDAPGTKRKH
jgi:hypothetical protein